LNEEAANIDFEEVASLLERFQILEAATALECFYIFWNDKEKSAFPPALFS
jgi:hypothetical protein